MLIRTPGRILALTLPLLFQTTQCLKADCASSDTSCGPGSLLLSPSVLNALSGGSGKNIFVVLGSGIGTAIYDTSTDQFRLGPPLLGAAGDGAHSVLLTSGPNAGKVFTVSAGATTNTSILNFSDGSSVSGPPISSAPGAGSQIFAVTTGTNAGKYLILTGNGGISVDVYDPVLNSIGPNGSGPSSIVGSGASSFFSSTESRFILLNGLGTTANVYDPATNSFLNLGTVPTAPGTGSAAIQLRSGVNSGSFLIYTAGASGNSMIYTPNAITPPGTFGSFVTICTAFNLSFGSNVFINEPTKEIIFLQGGNSNATCIYDPAVASFTTGPTTSGPLSSDSATAPINFGAHTGQTLVIHGGGTTGTSYWDPVGRTFSPGPALPSNANLGAHALLIP